MSGVLEYRRQVAPPQFYMTAEKIYDEVMDLVYREMGIRKKIYNINIYDKKHILTDDEKKIINEILESHNIEYDKIDVIRKIPSFCIEKDSKYLYKKCISLLDNIIMGNEMFPHNNLEYIVRELYFRKAKACCKAISNHLVRFARFYKIKISKFKNINQSIQLEIKLLEGLIDSDKGRFKQYDESINNFYKFIENNVSKDISSNTTKKAIETNNEIMKDFLKSENINN